MPFTINDGDTTPAIANRLEEQKLVTDSRAVVYEAFHQQAGDAWRAGLYELRANMTPGEVVSTLQQGPPPDPIVTIGLREGLRLEQITALLEKLHNEQGLQMDPKDFYDLVTKPPADLLKSYPWLHLPNGASLEGFLGPATYRVHPDVTAEDFVRMLLDHFYDTVGTDRLNVPKARGMSFYQVLTLASIVEQEAIVDSERPLIAGVYQNRLAKKMPLSADPTVIYAYDTGKLRNTPFDQWVSYFFWDVPKNYPGMSAVPVPDDLVKYQTYNRAGLIPGPDRDAHPGLDRRGAGAEHEAGVPVLRGEEGRFQHARVRQDRSRTHREPEEVRLHQVGRCRIGGTAVDKSLAARHTFVIDLHCASRSAIRSARC